MFDGLAALDIQVFILKGHLDGILFPDHQYQIININ